MNVTDARSSRNAAKKLAATAPSEVAAETNAALKPLKLAPKGPVEVSQGDGLGALVSAEEGRERLAAYATTP